MRRWTTFVLRHRRWVLSAWVVFALAGFVAFGRLAPLLTNQFSVPGTDSERVRTVLEREFGDRPDGSFQLVFSVRDAGDAALRRRLQAVVARAAGAVRTGRPTPIRRVGTNLLYADLLSTLDFSEAKGYTDDVVRSVGRPRGVVAAYVTGAPAIQHDLDPIFNEDLVKGEAIALPIAFLVLVGVFGLSLAVTIPFVFAGCTIFGTLGIIWVIAHFATTPTYATNLIQLIGLGLAIDYSLLVVYRFREELGGGLEKDEAVVRTME